MNMAQWHHLHLILILSSDNLIFFYVIYAKILLEIYRAFTTPKNDIISISLFFTS